MTQAAPVIGVWGHFADANLGDDACAAALLHHLKPRIPNARFVLFCRFPEVAQGIWDLPAYPVRPLSRRENGPREPSAPQTSAASSPTWRTRARAIPLLRAVVHVARRIVGLGRALPAELRFVWQSYHRLRGIDLLVIAGSNPLFDFTLSVERIRAARRAIDATGTGVVLTARSEGFICGRPDLQDTIRRLTAYAEAGADCLYAPGIRDAKDIRAVVTAVAPKPVNLLVGGDFTTVERLAQLGVRRISVGGALARAAWSGFLTAAKEIAAEGTFAALGGAIPFAEINGSFSRGRSAE